MRARVIPVSPQACMCCHACAHDGVWYDQVTGVLLTVGALFAPASAFGFARPTCIGPRQASARSGVTSLQATAGRALDPMSLVYNKDMQQCPLRVSPERVLQTVAHASPARLTRPPTSFSPTNRPRTTMGSRLPRLRWGDFGIPRLLLVFCLATCGMLADFQVRGRK